MEPSALGLRLKQGMRVVALASLLALAACSASSRAVRSTHPAPVDDAPGCRPSQLALRIGSYTEAGGQFSQTFTFVNVSPETCRLGGWPRVRATAAAGQPIVTETRHVSQSALSQPAWRAVVLTARQTASFDVYGEGFDALHNRLCPETSFVAVLAPGVGAPLTVSLRIPDCGTLEIAPVISGPTDNKAWSVVAH
jgi:hypothetical protein